MSTPAFGPPSTLSVPSIPPHVNGNWTAMGAVTGKLGAKVEEDFTSMRGGIRFELGNGARVELAKSLEATYPETPTFRGHSLASILKSDHDLLGSELLAGGKDPIFSEVSACLAPINTMETASFVGTPDCPDKVGVTYGGRTANFDPAVYVPQIEKIRSAKRVLCGLLGGWLPALRFVYPESDSTWTEFVMFAPLRVDNANPRVQPVWYRVCRIENDRLAWSRVFDSANPYPPHQEGNPADFYRDLLALKEGWEQLTQGGMRVNLPDKRLENLCRHSIARSMMTRIGMFPKYGVLDRNYGGSEHDGFQDTFNADTTAMTDWGLFGQAQGIVENYLSYFVRDDGSILYRGPQTGQYGRMLTVVAEYYQRSGDAKLLLRHSKRLNAVADLLLKMRREAQQRSHDDPAYGMISGWCEADSCLESDPARYMQPYLSNSAEAARGFKELGAAWHAIGLAENDGDLISAGDRWLKEGKELQRDLLVAASRSQLATQPPCIPSIAGAGEPPHIAANKDVHDPQCRAYRAYMEMLFSGQLEKAQVETIVNYREANRDILAGVPTAYGFNSGEIAGFLSYGHGYGLLQVDRIPEFLLELYSLSAHQYTRGTWTAPETRRIDPDSAAAPYAVPAQVSVPMLVRWMLVYEEPEADTIWLCKGTPREWLAAGKKFSFSDAPTRAGEVGLEVESVLAEGRILASVQLPKRGKLILRLRAPEGMRLVKVECDGASWSQFDAAAETITFERCHGQRAHLAAFFGAG